MLSAGGTGRGWPSAGGSPLEFLLDRRDASAVYYVCRLSLSASARRGRRVADLGLRRECRWGGKGGAMQAESTVYHMARALVPVAAHRRLTPYKRQSLILIERSRNFVENKRSTSVRQGAKPESC